MRCVCAQYATQPIQRHDADLSKYDDGLSDVDSESLYWRAFHLYVSLLSFMVTKIPIYRTKSRIGVGVLLKRGCKIDPHQMRCGNLESHNWNLTGDTDFVIEELVEKNGDHSNGGFTCVLSCAQPLRSMDRTPSCVCACFGVFWEGQCTTLTRINTSAHILSFS